MNAEPPTVFVVDDDVSVRRAVARLLRTAGFRVETYESGREFLDAVAERRGGCVLLDVRMPSMSGFEVLERLSWRRQWFPVVLITGDCDGPADVRAMNAGCAGFLAKPFDAVVLLDAIRRALQLEHGQSPA